MIFKKRKIVQLFYTVIRKYSNEVNEKCCFPLKKNQQMRFLDYLDKNNNNLKAKMIKIVDDNEQFINLKNKHYDHKNIWKEELDEQQVKKLLNTESYWNLRQSLSDIDFKCCSFIEQLSPSEIFFYLTLLIKINPSRISCLVFYEKSIELLKTALKRNQLTKHESLKLLFFSGFKKKKGAHNVKFIFKCMPSLDNWSLIEQCILAETLFKCGIKFKKVDGKIIENIIEDNAELLVEEKSLLISLCKALRHVGPSEYFTMKNLSKALINTKDKFNLIFIAHIVSLYAETYSKESDVLEKLFNNSWPQIEAKNKEIRLKDVDRLLWSGRILNYQIDEENFLILRQFLIKKRQSLEKNNSIYMNILLSLWMYGDKPKNIINECFKNKIFESIITDKSLWKPKARLQLLLACIKIESPDMNIPKNLQEPHDVGQKIKKNLKKTLAYLNLLGNNFQINNIVINSPIEEIYILGISLNHTLLGKIHIDLLDKNTCLKDSKEPHGLLNLKLRLLQKIGYQSLLISEEKISDETTFRFFLEEYFNSNTASHLKLKKLV